MKSITKYIILFFGAYYLLSGIVALIFAKFTLGSLMSIFIGVYLCLYTARQDIFRKFCKTKALTLIKHIVFAGCIFVIAFSAFLEIYGTTDNTTKKEDAVIVLGAAVNGDKLSAALKSRLDTAFEYLNDNQKAVAVVSGGKGRDEIISEAEAMENYLVSLGIDKKRIIKEEESTSTFENFKFSKEILDKKLGDNYRVVLVTNNFHVLRASFISKNAGLDCTHMGSNIYWLDLPSNCARETLALFKYLLIGR